jgi:hypothetical protein
VWVERAARNNAEWCDAVCAAHGLAGTFRDHAWTCGNRTPPLYPDAVTLDAAATADDVLAHVDTASAGCSIKDSFGNLELASSGFRVLFDATWIARTAEAAGARVPNAWSEVTDARTLERWCHVSDRRIHDQLLARDNIVVVAGRCSATDEDIVAGAVLNRSESVVGISNLFARDGDLDAAWSACLAFTGDRFPALPAVGYEAGAPLASALRHGFESIGQLRIWIDDRGEQT